MALKSVKSQILIATLILPVASLVVYLKARVGAFVSMDSFPLIFAEVLIPAAFCTLLLWKDKALPGRTFLVLLTAAVALLSVKAHGDYKASQATHYEGIGKQALLDRPAPPLAYQQNFQLSNEQSEMLESRQNKIFLFDFWATFCDPCLEQMPKLAQLQERFPEELLVIGFTRFYDLPERRTQELEGILSMVARTGVNYPILVADDDRTWTDYQIRVLPTSVLLGRSGKVIEYGIGIDGTDRVLRAAEGLLDEGTRR